MKKQKGCEIEARGINYHIKIPSSATPLRVCSRRDGRKSPPSKQPSIRHVLRNVNCRAKPGEILAIVGPSGAGKSTLLEILAGQLSPSIPPEIFVDGKPADRSAFRKITGYVTQGDVLFPLLTARETLMFSAQLRVGARRPETELRSLVDSLIRELGLDAVAETRVNKLSGGERRRVSIGVEVVHDPRVLVLDEPTSGLDSTSAMQIAGMLKDMAGIHGRTVILSIHQPGARIVGMLGSVLLLADGAVLHHGTVDQLQSRLADAGHRLPPHVNAVEFAIDSIDVLRQSQPLTSAPNSERPRPAKTDGKRDRCTLQQLFQLHKVADEETMTTAVSGKIITASRHDCSNNRVEFPNSPPQEVAVLTHRFFKNVCRTRQLFACRTVSMLAAGLVLGSIFYKLDGSKLTERVGLFAFMLTFLLSSTTEALPIFLRERSILMKETSSGSYRISSYVIANAVVFLPFLLIVAIVFTLPMYWLVGLRPTFDAFTYFLFLIWLILYTANSVVICITSIAPNFIVGNSIIAGVMGSFFLFSGFFITKDAMPGVWVFMHYLSLFKYPLEALLANEFAGPGVCAMSEAGECIITGDQLLRKEGIALEQRWKNAGIMAGFVLAYRFIGYIALVVRCRCAQTGGLRRALSWS